MKQSPQILANKSSSSLSMNHSNKLSTISTSETNFNKYFANDSTNNISSIKNKLIENNNGLFNESKLVLESSSPSSTSSSSSSSMQLSHHVCLKKVNEMSITNGYLLKENEFSKSSLNTYNDDQTFQARCNQITACLSTYTGPYTDNIPYYSNVNYLPQDNNISFSNNNQNYYDSSNNDNNNNNNNINSNIDDNEFMINDKYHVSQPSYNNDQGVYWQNGSNLVHHHHHHHHNHLSYNQSLYFDSNSSSAVMQDGEMNPLINNNNNNQHDYETIRSNTTSSTSLNSSCIRKLNEDSNDLSHDETIQ